MSAMRSVSRAIRELCIGHYRPSRMYVPRPLYARLAQGVLELVPHVAGPLHPLNIKDPELDKVGFDSLMYEGVYIVCDPGVENDFTTGEEVWASPKGCDKASHAHILAAPFGAVYPVHLGGIMKLPYDTNPAIGWGPFTLPGDHPFFRAAVVHDAAYQDVIEGISRITIKEADDRFLRNCLRIAVSEGWRLKDIGEWARLRREAHMCYAVCRWWAKYIRPELESYVPNER